MRSLTECRTNMRLEVISLPRLGTKPIRGQSDFDRAQTALAAHGRFKICDLVTTVTGSQLVVDPNNKRRPRMDDVFN